MCKSIPEEDKNIMTDQGEEVEIAESDHASKYHRYQGVTYETPAFHLLFGCLLPKLRPLLEKLVAFRWKWSRPLQVKVLPKWFPLLPGLKWAAYVTIGEVILGVPILLLLIAGYLFSFLSPELDGSGTIAAMAIMGSFITANKASSPISFLLGIPIERMIPYHNMCSLVAVVLSIFHTYVAFTYGSSGSEDAGDDEESPDFDRRLGSSGDVDSIYADFGPQPDLIKFLLDGWTNLSGTILIICMIALVSTSFFSVLRRWFFEAWLFTHIASTVGVVVFSVVHGSNTIFIVAIWWMADLFIRYLLMPLYVYPREASLELVSPDVVEVRFPKPEKFCYNAGQYVRVAFPSISTTQLHPITISSAPHESHVTLHIRAYGTWSKNLVKLAEKNTNTSMLLEGPYGQVGVDLDDDDRYQIVLLVSGGIGVTPCQSITKHLLHAHATEGRKLEQVHFCWAVPTAEMAQNIPPPSIESEKLEDASILSTNIYITRSKPTENNIEKDQEVAKGTIASHYELHSGRPDLEATFLALKEKAQAKSLRHIAVVACGPSGLLQQVRATCRSLSDRPIMGCAGDDDKGVTFDLHEEIFEY